MTTTPRPIGVQRLSDVQPARIDRTTKSGLPLYRGMLHALVGEGEAGKTWIAAHAVLDVAHNGGQVLVLDGEMSAPAWRRRADALNAQPEALQLIAYAEMTDAAAKVDPILATCADLTDNGRPAVGLVVWDSALSMLSRSARSENDNAEVSRVYDQLRDVVRRANTAGLIVDHTPRGATNLISRGATAKFNALDISYGVRLAEGSIPGQHGAWSSIISVEKDRHGLLGKREDREAYFYPLGGDGLNLEIHTLDAATHRLAADNPIEAAITRIDALNPPAKSGNDAYARIGGKRTTALAAYKQWKDGQA